MAERLTRDRVEKIAIDLEGSQETAIRAYLRAHNIGIGQGLTLSNSRVFHDPDSEITAIAIEGHCLICIAPPDLEPETAAEESANILGHLIAELDLIEKIEAAQAAGSGKGIVITRVPFTDPADNDPN